MVQWSLENIFTRPRGLQLLILLAHRKTKPALEAPQKSSSSDFQNRRSSHDSSVVDSLSTVAQHKVALSRNTLRRYFNAEVDTIARLGEVSEDRPSGGNERGVKLRSPGARRQSRSRLELHRLTSSDGSGGGSSDGRVGFHGQGWVGRRAGFDESGREGVDRVGSERDVIGRRERAELLLRGSVAQVRRVARLDGENRAGGSEVVFVSDLAGSTEVGADTNAFEDAGDAEELCDRGRWEAVDAFFRGGGAESGGQEVYVGFLVGGDFGQTSVG